MGTSALDKLLQRNSSYMLYKNALGHCVIYLDGESDYAWRCCDYFASVDALSQFISEGNLLSRKIETLDLSTVIKTMADQNIRHARKRSGVRLPIAGVRSLKSFVLRYRDHFVLATNGAYLLARSRSPNHDVVGRAVSPQFSRIEDLEAWFKSYCGTLREGDYVLVDYEDDPCGVFAELQAIDPDQSYQIVPDANDPQRFVMMNVFDKAAERSVISPSFPSMKDIAAWYIETFKSKKPDFASWGTIVNL